MQTPESFRSSFLKTVGIGFAVALTVLVLNGVELYRSLANVEKTTDWATGSHEALEALDSLLSHVTDIETGQRGYVLTGEDKFLDTYRFGLAAIDQDKHDVRNRLGYDDLRRRQLDRLESLIDEKIRLVQQIIAIRQSRGLRQVAGAAILEESKATMDNFRTAVRELRIDEERRLTERLDEARHFMQRSFQAAMFGKALAVSVLLWLFILIRRETARRTQAQDALRKVNEGLESHVNERTAQLIGANERLTILSRELLHVQEGERRRIARDLHDELGQSLLALKLNLREVEEQTNATATGKKVRESLEILGGVIDGVRSLALDLRPSLLDELGLVAAARWYVARQGERSGWTTKFDAAQLPDGLSPDTAITCFRILQEALTNVTKHAKATRVGVTIEQQGERLMMTVSDNGTGFKIEEATTAARRGASVGLLAMEERAYLVGGRVMINSNDAGGTMITVSLPFSEPDMPRQKPLEAVA